MRRSRELRAKPPTGTLTAHVLVEVVAIKRNRFGRPSVVLRSFIHDAATPKSVPLYPGDHLEIEAHLTVRP